MCLIIKSNNKVCHKKQNDAARKITKTNYRLFYYFFLRYIEKVFYMINRSDGDYGIYRQKISVYTKQKIYRHFMKTTNIEFVNNEKM